MAKSNKVKGEGTWDIVVKKGVELHRFRKTYNNERKEFTGKTRKVVLEKIKAYEANPTTRSQKATLKMPFYKYLEEYNLYLREYNREQDYSVFKRRNHYINHIKETPLGKAQLGSVNAKLITEFLFLMVDKNLAKETINKDYRFIKNALQHACDDRILEHNPALLVAAIKEREVKKPAKVVKPFGTKDMLKLIKESQRVNTKESQINGEVGSRVYGVNADVIIFQMITGLRIGEVLGLTWKNVDFDKERIHITGALKEVTGKDGKVRRELGTTKTENSNRKLKLCAGAIEILKEQKNRNPKAEEDDFVFISDLGNPISRRNVNRTLRAMAERCECEHKEVGSHVLRHTYASFLATQHIDLFTISQLLGHSTIKTTSDVYARYLEEDGGNEITNLFDSLWK